MIHLLIYIQKKTPVLIQNVFHYNLQIIFIFQKFCKKAAHLICPAFPVIHTGNHSGMIYDLFCPQFQSCLITLCKPCHRHLTDQTVKSSRIQIQKRSMKYQRRISHLFQFFLI